MRVVTGRARHSSVTLLSASAQMHLFDLADSGGRIAGGFTSVSAHKSCPDVDQSVSRTEIVLRPPVTQDPLDSQDVTLIADVILEL